MKPQPTPPRHPAHVLCVGDVMLDRFVHGSVHRISPEGPVPVARITSSEDVAGGAANVCRNVTALAGSCTVIGVIGDDAAGAAVQASLAATPQASPHLIVDPKRPTTEKIRYVAQGQQLLRVDVEDATPVAPEVARQIVDAVRHELPEADVLVLSDYAKGVLTPEVVSAVIAQARALGKPVVVDPKTSDLSRYAGATVVTPNGKETREATGIDPGTDADAEAAGIQALQHAGLQAILITRAERGMSLVRRDAPPLHIPTHAREVFDVVGAGDTVVATLALALAEGRPLDEAARLANVAAGIVVGKAGTATVSRAELEAELASEARAGVAPSREKIKQPDDLADLVRRWQKQGLKVGFTNGCFDLLHVGHITLLEFARAHCDRLVVALNSDASVKRLKGAERPVTAEQDRLRVVAALQAVDAAVLFAEDTPAEIIQRLAPDVLVKGADYRIDQIVGADAVLGRGGQVLTCELVPAHSTTNIIRHIASAPNRGTSTLR